MIWHTCSGVNFAGAPQRGASTSRSATLTTSSGRHIPKREPAPPPMARCFVIQVEPTRDLGVVQPVAGCKHNARSHGELLTRGIPAHQALQLSPFLLTQHNLGRSW